MFTHRLKGLLVAAVLAPALAHAGPAAAAPVDQPARKPVTDLGLTLTSSAEPVSGETVTFTGTAPASMSGATVKLKRQVGTGDWIKVATARVSAEGTYEVSGVATGVGRNAFRTVASFQRVKHRSKVVKTLVFSWFNVTDGNEVDEDGLYEGSATIGGQGYNKSLYSFWQAGNWGETAWAEYNVSYRCKTLETSIGVDDDSETGFKAKFAILLDGASTSYGTKGLGPAQLITVDVSSRLRVRYEVQPAAGIPSSGIDGHGVFGTPRVLCSGKP